jgi:hypothetical protein
MHGLSANAKPDDILGRRAEGSTPGEFAEEGELKPKLEMVFGRYVGMHADIDLKPDTQAIEEWLAQQLTICLATDPNSG